MIYLIIFIFSLVVALGAGALSAMSDFKGLTIPNLYSLIVAGTALCAVGASYMAGAGVMGAPLAHLLTGGVVFVVTFALFLLKAFGGGDSKLLTAYALWVGLKGIVALLFYMALSGALLGLVAIIIKKKKPFKSPREGGWIARMQAGENRVPYGIPIVIGAFAAFLKMELFSPATFGAFVQ